MIKYGFFTLLLAFSFNNSFYGANCEVISSSEINTISNNHLTQETSCLLQINKREADNYATRVLFYSKMDKIYAITAQIEDLNGNVIRKLKSSEIITQSAYSEMLFFSDYFIKKFTLRHNVYPYRIRYSYKQYYNEFSEITTWEPNIDDKVPVREAMLEVRTPKNYPVFYKLNNINKPQIDTLENEIVYRFKATNLNIPDDESFSPSRLINLPFVKFMPESFTWVCKGSHKSWKDYGNWVFRLTNNLNVLPESDKQTVHSLTDNLTNRFEKIKVLYHYLQDNFRYVNVSMDVGGLVPYPAEYVSKNHYGDCKALTVYMSALLKEVGIASNYATVYAGDDPPEFINSLPCQQANHMLLVVPSPKDTIYLECTSNNTPVGYVGSFTQNRKALLISENDSKIINMPSFKPADVFVSKKYEFNITNENEIDLKLTNSYKGYSFDEFNSLNTDLTPKETEDIIREKILPFSDFELSKWNLSKPGRDSVFNIFHAELKLNNYLQKYGNNQGFSLISYNLPKLEKPSERKQPIHIDRIINQIDTTEISLTSAYHFFSIPENVTIEAVYGEISINYQKEKENDKLKIIRHLLINKGDYPLSDYPDFYAFISNIEKTNKKFILINKI
jgi:hypothetical protein